MDFFFLSFCLGENDFFGAKWKYTWILMMMMDDNIFVQIIPLRYSKINLVAFLLFHTYDFLFFLLEFHFLYGLPVLVSLLLFVRNFIIIQMPKCANIHADIVFILLMHPEFVFYFYFKFRIVAYDARRLHVNQTSWMQTIKAKHYYYL